jgi:hypothetical protein
VAGRRGKKRKEGGREVGRLKKDGPQLGWKEREGLGRGFGFFFFSNSFQTFEI